MFVRVCRILDPPRFWGSSTWTMRAKGARLHGSDRRLHRAQAPASLEQMILMAAQPSHAVFLRPIVLRLRGCVWDKE